MICRCCGQEFADIMFRKIKGTPYRRRLECRECGRIIAQKTNKRIASDPKKRAKRMQQQKEYRERNRKAVRKYQRDYHREYRKLQRQRALL